MHPLTPYLSDQGPASHDVDLSGLKTQPDDGTKSSDEANSKRSKSSKHKRTHIRRNFPVSSNSTSRSTLHSHGRRKKDGDEVDADPLQSTSPFHMTSSLHSKGDNSKQSLRQDYKWTEIDMLDDVRQMSQMQFYADGFPQDFERKLEKTRESQAQLFRLMKKRNTTLQATKRKTVRDSHVDEDSNIHVEDEGMEPFDQEELEKTKNEERNYVRNIVNIVNSLR